MTGWHLLYIAAGFVALGLVLLILAIVDRWDQ